MSFSELFIRRPVATTLLTIGVALAGAVAFKLLPVAPLPQVDFPTISVTAGLPGASPEVMAATVATPLERSLGRIAGVTEITSQSSLGNTRITLQFELSRDIDGAAADVQAAIQAARTDLPSSLPSNPSYRKVNPADAPVMILALTSDSLTRGQMYDAASTVIAQKLSQVAGVGQVTVGGGSLPAVRVELNPTVLNRLAISMDDVPKPITANNAKRSVGLVIMLVFLFRRNFRASLIPAVAGPVSLVGTFSIMWLAGYSLNNLSLMAMTIATGFVVDDAIVVLENVSRHIEAGMKPFDAALRGAREVSFTVISMSLSLIAVFIPILLMGGIIGRLFREFAVTLSVAILVSLLVSLTTTPMMCAKLLRPHVESKRGRLVMRLAGWGERFSAGILRGYEKSLGWVLRHPLLMIMVLVATIGLNFYLYVIVPKGFMPQQDTGLLIGGVQGDQSISFQAMQLKLGEFVDIVQSDDAVESVTAFTGGGQRNSGPMFIFLKKLNFPKNLAHGGVGRLPGRLAKR